MGMFDSVNIECQIDDVPPGAWQTKSLECCNDKYVIAYSDDSGFAGYPGMLFCNTVRSHYSGAIECYRAEGDDLILWLKDGVVLDQIYRPGVK